MKIIFNLLFWSCLALTLLSSCAEKTSQESAKVLADTTGISSSGTMRFEGVLISVPSPAQVAMLIQKQNIEFKENYLNSLLNRSKYLNQTKKALNLGVYGSDLAYISNYNLGQINNDYFDAIAGLSSELGILDNIDKQLVARLSNNLGNKDSIIYLNTEFYRAADNYLKSNDKPQLSSFILIGGWLESLHITCQEASAHTELRQRLAEQKYSAENVIILTEKLDDPVFNPVKQELISLCKLFLDLESTYTYRQPITDHREKVTYLRSQTTITLPDDRLNQIIAQVEKIRNTIIE
jgi:hypothetical protein